MMIVLTQFRRDLESRFVLGVGEQQLAATEQDIRVVVHRIDRVGAQERGL